MSNLINKCTLKDIKVLRDLILENPELPLLIFCGEDVWDGEHPYVQADAARGEVEELTLYKDRWLNREDYADRLCENLYLEDEEKYKNLTDEEHDKLIDEKVEETEFVEAIVLWVG